MNNKTGASMRDNNSVLPEPEPIAITHIGILKSSMSISLKRIPKSAIDKTTEIILSSLTRSSAI